MFINLEYNRSRVPISIQIESKSNGPFLMLSNRLAQVTGFINRDIFQFFSDILYCPVPFSVKKIYIFWWKWPIISYVYKSCCSGYSIVTHGPKSDFKNVACETNSAIFSSSDLNLSGTYGIRIESRENNELGNDHNFLPLYISVLNGFVQEKWFPGSCISRLVLLSWSTWYRSWTNLSYDRGIVDE